jgi:glutathione S-transferase
MSEFILHHYWPSPFAHKIRLAFGLAEVEWNSV